MNASPGRQAGIPHPYAIQRPDRIPVQRYFDAEFYALEREKLWPRVWQMACRLEEIPEPGDFVVYEIFDQSVIVTRVDANTVKAFHNACRHRGVQLVQDRGSAPEGFTCPFHGWQWKTDGKCKFVYSPTLFEKDQLKGQDLAKDFVMPLARSWVLSRLGGTFRSVYLKARMTAPVRTSPPPSQ